MNLAFLIEWWNYQRRERQKSLFTQMPVLGDLYFGAIRQQHPDRNLQSLARWIDDRDRTISPLRPAKDLKGRTIERVERVENPDVRTSCAQGIVGVGATKDHGHMAALAPSAQVVVGAVREIMVEILDVQAHAASDSADSRMWLTVPGAAIGKCWRAFAAIASAGQDALADLQQLLNGRPPTSIHRLGFTVFVIAIV